MRKGPDDYGGMWGQLQKLRMGKHPKTGKPLPAPVDQNGAAVDEQRRYARLDRRRTDENALSIVPFDESNRFAPYVPQPARVLRPNEGRSAKDKMSDMLQRVEGKASTSSTDSSRRFRMRGKQEPRRTMNAAALQ